MLFFFNDAATTEIYTLSQHDARPIFFGRSRAKDRPVSAGGESPERVEGAGETVGEAKWAALRELERLYPGVDKGSVRFEVLSEGERGLLGVGYAPARVAASLVAAATSLETSPASAEEPGSPAGRLRELLEHVCAALGLRATIRIDESERELRARLSGPDLGLLIGRRGQTIDAVQL